MDMHVLKKYRVIQIIIIVLYVFIHLYIFGLHEAWRDESQAWVLTQNSTLFEIFGLCASEGHPCLWFLILFPFTRLGLSFYCFSFISILFMSLSLFIFLSKSPFGIFIDILLVFSPLFLYYNPVICRVYSVLLFEIVMLCSIWKERRKSAFFYGIITALIIQTHVLTLGITIGLLIDQIFGLVKKDTRTIKNQLLGFILSILSFVAMLFELQQTDNTETYLHVSIEGVLNRFTFDNMYSAMESFAERFERSGWLLLGVTFILYVCIILFYLIGSKRRSSCICEFIVMICSISIYWGILVLVRHTDHIQMAIVFLMITLMTCWIFCACGDRVLALLCKAGLVVISIILLPGTFEDIEYDLYEPYSGSKEIVSIINNTAPIGSIIILRNNEYATSIFSYLEESDNDYFFWDLDNASEYKLHKWGKPNKRNISEDSEIIENIKNDFADDGLRRIYYVSSEMIDRVSGLTYENMNSEPNKWNENYVLYRVEQ